MQHSELTTPRLPSFVCCALGVLLVILGMPGSGAHAAVATLAPDELVPGQMGVGYCVFKGTQVDSFGVEILGVQHDVLQPGRDLILARLAGANLEATGIFHGMSGSPVYVEGQLIGAIAHGWGFAMEPICGITPIGEMLEILEQDLSGPSYYSATPPAMGPDGNPQPLPLPVWVSGIGRSGRAFLTDLLEPMGMVPVTGAGGTADLATVDSEIRPGSSIGVQLINGDMNMSAIGTVTWIDGERLLAFGHPYMAIGAVDMPITHTVIHGVMPSQYASFVLGSTGEEIGALRQDRLAGVAGILGAQARMLPVSVSVAGPSGNHTLNTRVLDHAILSGSLAQIVVFSALESLERLFGVASLDVHLEVRLTDGRQLSWNQVFSGLHAPFLAARSVGGPLASLTWSGFEDVHLEQVHVSISIRDDMRIAEIEAARHVPGKPQAGKPLAVEVELDPFQAPEQQLTFDLVLPPAAEGLPVRVLIGNGSASVAWAQERQIEAPPRDSDELLERLGRSRRNDELVIEVVAEEPGLALDGQPLLSLPASVGRLLRQTPSVGRIGPVFGTVLQTQRLRVPFVLEGEQVIELGQIER